MPEDARPDVVHQSGERNFAALQDRYRESRVKAEVLAFIDDMAARYSWCDVMIARAGAITVAEIGVAGVAAILFPLPWFVAKEQAGNAEFLASRGAAMSLAQLETSPESLARLLAGLTRDKLAAMAAAARVARQAGGDAELRGLCEVMGGVGA